MAKVNTRSTYKVQGFRVDFPLNHETNNTTREHYVLRSDGAILWDVQVAHQYINQPLYWGSRNLKVRWQLKSDVNLQTFDFLNFVTRRAHLQNPNATITLTGSN